MEIRVSTLSKENWIYFTTKGNETKIILTQEETNELANKLIETRRYKEPERIKFSKNFKKLNDNEFTTIRAKDKNVLINEIVLIQSPTMEFTARCKSVKKQILHDFHVGILKKDLECFCAPYSSVADCYRNCLKELQNYYPGLSLDSVVYLYGFEKEDKTQ